VSILGLSAFHHDNATALIENAPVGAAAQNERFTRKKFDASFPKRSIARVQTVHRTTSPLCYEVIDRFNRLPVASQHRLQRAQRACKPEDAFRCFMGTNIDMPAVGNAVLRRRVGRGVEGELRRPVRVGLRRYPFRLSAVRCGGVR
jgi:predicted NodU family carbamoyl transferase